jgi:hypothetical protein
MYMESFAYKWDMVVISRFETLGLVLRVEAMIGVQKISCNSIPISFRNHNPCVVHHTTKHALDREYLSYK